MYREAATTVRVGRGWTLLENTRPAVHLLSRYRRLHAAEAHDEEIPTPSRPGEREGRDPARFTLLPRLDAPRRREPRWHESTACGRQDGCAGKRDGLAWSCCHLYCLVLVRAVNVLIAPVPLSHRLHVLLSSTHHSPRGLRLVARVSSSPLQSLTLKSLFCQDIKCNQVNFSILSTIPQPTIFR